MIIYLLDCVVSHLHDFVDWNENINHINFFLQIKLDVLAFYYLCGCIRFILYDSKCFFSCWVTFSKKFYSPTVTNLTSRPNNIRRVFPNRLRDQKMSLSKISSLSQLRSLLKTPAASNVINTGKFTTLSCLRSLISWISHDFYAKSFFTADWITLPIHEKNLESNW